MGKGKVRVVDYAQFTGAIHGLVELKSKMFLNFFFVVVVFLKLQEAL